MSTRPGTATALVVVDLQVGVVAHAWNRDAVVANVGIALERARKAGAPVIWVQHSDPRELPRGTPSWAFVPELQPAPGEAVVHKRYNSAFEETGLAALLDEAHVSHVVLAGASTNACIRATAYAALDRGFDLTLVADAHTTDDFEAAPGRLVRAESVVDDLNVAMRWLSYPNRTNVATPAADLAFASGAA